ncbi:MAG: pantoate--beta-alanine ligase, partial [Pseudohongiellaceae bacterium]
MRIITTAAELRRLLAHEKSQGSRIGLVPTMGNLHAGHIKLVTTAREQCDYVVGTIFVNPLQFGTDEDLEIYPRTPDEDIKKLTESGCNGLFMPSVAEMYPGGTAAHTLVSVPGLGDNYCGKSRPGHFDGVATVVSKLLNLVQPDSAFFGLKDYQQYLVISKMALDLQIPVRIIGVETVREASGLAMSSRNNYLTAEQKVRAANLYRSLGFVAEALDKGRTDFAELENQARTMLNDKGLTPDYFAVCHALTLEPAT